MYPTGASTQNAAANGRGNSGLPPSRPRFARLTLQDEAPPLNEAELPPDPPPAETVGKKGKKKGGKKKK